MPEAKNKNIQGSAARKKAGAQKARTSPAKRPRRKKRKPKKVNIGVWTAVGIAASVILALAVMFISQGGGGGHETGATESTSPTTTPATSFGIPFTC